MGTEMDKPERTNLIVEMKVTEKEMLRKISEYTSISMSAKVRAWIRKAYAALPVEAK
jgi:hypothetical protein